MFRKQFTLALLTALVSFASPMKVNAQVSDAQFGELMKKYLASDAGIKELGGSVEKYFMNRQKQQQEEQEKQQKVELEEQFKSPLKVDVGNAPTKGPANAKITIVKFSDFQCPFCKRGADNLEAVIKAYPNDVKVAFKNLPLPMHKEAKSAAYAGLAANKQGKFWQFYDALYNGASQLGQAFYEQKAKEFGLDVEKFKKDMESQEVKDQVEADMKQAESLKVNATPAFFVNGIAVRGAYPPEHFKTIIDRLLKK